MYCIVSPVIARGDDSYSRLSANNIDRWLTNLGTLEQHTVLWPRPSSLLWRGSKLGTLDQLGDIANNITFTDYPQTLHISWQQIHDAEFLEHLRSNSNVLVKCGFSDGALHVLRPSEVENLQERMLHESELYQSPLMQQLGIIPEWFAVPFISEFAEKGELRVYFVGGVLSYMLLTKWKSEAVMAAKEVRWVIPLQHLR